MFQRVAIIGVGLIGGSLGLEIKKQRLAKEVMGCGRSRKNLRVALSRRLIDTITMSPRKAVQGADLVLLCSPVKTILLQLNLLGPFFDKGALVMDVGSTKGEIMREARKLPSGIDFIGAHPMAGTERGGAGAAKEGLFRGKKCLLVPCPGNRPAVERAKRLWEKMGSEVTLVEAPWHDRALAVVSHLPHMTAYALVSTIASYLSVAQIKNLAGGGLMDTTRIAASPPEMWTDICLSNRENLLRVMNRYRLELARLAAFIEHRDQKGLCRYFDRSANLRRRF